MYNFYIIYNLYISILYTFLYNTHNPYISILYTLSIHFYIINRLNKYLYYKHYLYISILHNSIFLNYLFNNCGICRSENSHLESGVAVDQRESQCVVIRKSLVQFPGLHVEVPEPQTAPGVQVDTVHGSRRHQCVNICMNYCKSLWQKINLSLINGLKF